MEKPIKRFIRVTSEKCFTLDLIDHVIESEGLVVVLKDGSKHVVLRKFWDHARMVASREGLIR